MSGGPSDIAGRWNRGDAISTFTPEQRQRLREDMRSQADALHAKSPERARVMADLRQLYEADHPNESEPNPVLVNGRFIDLNIDLNGGQ